LGVDSERLMKTHEDWAKEQAEGIEHNRRVLERIRGMLSGEMLSNTIAYGSLSAPS